MPVVINEFEVVPESATTTTSTSPANPTSTNNTLTVLDLERMLKHQKARLERVRAH